ncbi:class I SAM-dependent methyltransferase [Pasteurellaceae bacterium LIM206]|nr:class I SAM-dependent methyltransferase [Pasteurellaceae bacterium LIM206]
MTNATSWDIYSVFYNPLIKTLQTQRQDVFQHLSPGTAPQQIYIAGCGTGADLSFLPANSRIVAADFSGAMLRKAERRAAELHFSHIHFQQGRAEYSGLADDSQDLVLLHLILAVTDQPQVLLDEAVRIVKPGGRISIWDKFLPDDKTAPLWRKGLNVLTRRLATSINLQVAPLLQGLPVEIVHRKFYFARLMQHIILTKKR